MKLTEQECIDFIKSTNGTKFEPSEINEICAIMKEKFILHPLLKSYRYTVDFESSLHPLS